MRLTSKQPTHMINYNGNSNFDFDNNAEFVDINLLCNKLSIQLLANNTITCAKKRYLLKTKNKVDEPSKVKAIQEKKIPIMQVKKKCLKVLILIFSLITKSFLNIQALFINTKIVIPMLYLFQIFLKF